MLVSTASLASSTRSYRGVSWAGRSGSSRLLAAGVALLGVFVLAERRAHGTPMIEPSLLRNRAFTSGLVVGIAFFPASPGC